MACLVSWSGESLVWWYGESQSFEWSSPENAWNPPAQSFWTSSLFINSFVSESGGFFWSAEFWVFGEVFTHPLSNFAIFSVLEAYVVDVSCTRRNQHVEEEERLDSEEDDVVAVVANVDVMIGATAGDKASERAFLAKWISVWSLLSHWPLGM